MTQTIPLQHVMFSRFKRLALGSLNISDTYSIYINHQRYIYMQLHIALYIQLHIALYIQLYSLKLCGAARIVYQVVLTSIPWTPHACGPPAEAAPEAHAHEVMLGPPP